MSDLNMSIQMAESRARQSLSFTLNANVQAMITDYCRNAGIAEILGRQITRSRLRDAYVLKKAVDRNGTVYCLVGLKKADASKTAAEIITRAAEQSDQYAAFRTLDALEKMDELLNRDEIKPVPVTQ